METIVSSDTVHIDSATPNNLWLIKVWDGVVCVEKQLHRTWSSRSYHQLREDKDKAQSYVFSPLLFIPLFVQITEGWRKIKQLNGQLPNNGKQAYTTTPFYHMLSYFSPLCAYLLNYLHTDVPYISMHVGISRCSLHKYVTLVKDVPTYVHFMGFHVCLYSHHQIFILVSGQINLLVLFYPINKI